MELGLLTNLQRGAGAWGMLGFCIIRGVAGVANRERCDNRLAQESRDSPGLQLLVSPLCYVSRIVLFRE